MSEDRELLELAAKALKLQRDEAGFLSKSGIPMNWNPLAQNPNGRADCFQMEIDLKFDVDYTHQECVWDVYGKKTGEDYIELLATHADRQRASTMAAAEIGRAM